jgi:hypothetical protein
MPHLELSHREAAGELPTVCMRCGGAAVCRVARDIRLYDMATGYGKPGILAVIYLLIDINRYFSSPTLRLRAPFCARHRQHWFVRRVLIWSLAALLPVMLAAMLVAYSSGVNSKLPQLFCVLGSTAVLVTCCIIYATSIVKIGSNKRSIFLSNVHSKFITALQEQRRCQAAQTRPASATPRRPAAIPVEGAVQTARPVAVPVDPAAERDPFENLDDASEDRQSTHRKTPAKQSTATLVFVLSLVLGVPLVLMLVLAVVLALGQGISDLGERGLAAAAGPERDEPEEPVVPGTRVPGALEQPPPPPDVDGKNTVDLIPLVTLQKDVVHGRWLVADNVLHCNDSSFVPRLQFPYRPPEEYDFVVTFSQYHLRNGISLIMPNPQGGSFFWYLGSGDGREYGFWPKPNKGGQSRGLIKAKKAYTTVVQVRRDGVRGLLDGKELVHVRTDFRDLTCDDWRKIRDTSRLAVACDDPTVFHYVRVVEITGSGRNAR